MAVDDNYGIRCECKCGHIWTSRVKQPAACPKCKRRNWNKVTEFYKNVHDIDIDTILYAMIIRNKKTFELLKTKLNPKQGDIILFKETISDLEANQHTGNTTSVTILSVLNNQHGLADGFCIASFFHGL